MLFFQPQLKLPDPWYLQVLFYLVPLVGLALVVEGFTRFGVLVVNKQLRGEVWQRIVASTYSDHIIIRGVGHIRFRVAEQLRNLEQEFVVVALESKFMERLLEWNVPVVVGDARDETLLRAATSGAIQGLFTKLSRQTAATPPGSQTGARRLLSCCG